MEANPQVALILLGLLAGMLLLLEIGYRAGRHRFERIGDKAETGLGVVEASIFALFGLLLAFAFSGAEQRLERRRILAADEANAIGTAYLRLDLLPPTSQPALRDLFRRYTDTRVEFYRKLTDPKAADALLADASRLQAQIWSEAVAACAVEPHDEARTILVLQAINPMIDITTTRVYAARSHTPTLVFVLLFFLGLCCSILAGFSMAAAGPRSAVHYVGFAIAAVLTIYVILDLEYPRVGLIRLDLFDRALADVRETMK